MKAAKPLMMLAILSILAIGAFLLIWRTTQDSLWVQDVTAAPLQGAPGSVGVFLTIRNRGPADRLLDVHSIVAQRAQLVSTLGDGLAIPADSSPVLAPDGAYIRMDGLGGTLEDGRLLPITLRFENAGEIRTQARLIAPQAQGVASEYGLFGIGDICQVEDGQPVPDVTLDVQPDGDGWRVQVTTRNFRFNTDAKDGKHEPGIGHAHLYLNGLKLQRVYENEVDIGALPAGIHEIRVTLNSKDHRTYVTSDTPVSAAVEIEVK
ncbi:copper chaperone PCu(A)C [Rhodobacteraceae bacterium F11138]|nr:copper chaperone PCu(A)C [Rhodobacteraceae bacterium F11138]